MRDKFKGKKIAFIQKNAYVGFWKTAERLTGKKSSWIYSHVMRNKSIEGRDSHLLNKLIKIIETNTFKKFNLEQDDTF